MEPTGRVIKVFLDANVLFSASLGGESFSLLWELAVAQRVTLITSRYCYAEAFDNLRRKFPNALPILVERMERVCVADAADADLAPASSLPEKDAPVLAAALRIGADVLLTGDRTHFGHLMTDTMLGIRVRTARAFLIDGPSAFAGG